MFGFSMKPFLLVILSLAIINQCHSAATDLQELEALLKARIESLENEQLQEKNFEAPVDETVEQTSNTERQTSPEDETLKDVVASLARQSMLQQLYIEEMTRSNGDSGIKQVRHNREGTSNYHSDNHIGHSHSSIHDHSNNIRTVGMGEVIAVLNGVEFRTRHNDYGLRQPHRSRSDYQLTSDISFPNAPGRVRGKATVDDQIVEMREWFKAFKEQDTTNRDYTNFFKPVLCYMEGMWTHAEELLDESFESDRHFIDANSWEELENKIRFLSYTGGKDTNENFAYLPRVIFNVTENGYPVYVQWNYDILCHPLSRDLPLDRLRVVDDLSGRMRDKQRLSDYENSRMARFQLNTDDAPFDGENSNRHSLLDSLMAEIPGKDNYNGYIEDKGMEDTKFRDADDRSKTLNAAYYHRAYQTLGSDAMGSQNRYRGYADENLYMAQTTQDKVAGVSFTECQGRQRPCAVYSQKWTYAIPLEIIYLTPLYKWNPYDIVYHGDDKTDPAYIAVTAGRTGKAGSPYDGTNSKNFYQTPYEFFNGDEVAVDSADTTPSGAVVVSDSSGTERAVTASGTRIFLPNIPGVGKIRTRYPISPVHGEGSGVWKELNAVKELVLNPGTLSYLVYNPITSSGGGSTDGDGGLSITLTYELRPANADFNQHQHQVTLGSYQIAQLQGQNNITVTTTQTVGHTHTLVLYAVDGKLGEVRYRTCDQRNWCFDGHAQRLDEVAEGTI